MDCRQSSQLFSTGASSFFTPAATSFLVNSQTSGLQWPVWSPVRRMLGISGTHHHRGHPTHSAPCRTSLAATVCFQASAQLIFRRFALPPTIALGQDFHRLLIIFSVSESTAIFHRRDDHHCPFRRTDFRKSPVGISQQGIFAFEVMFSSISHLRQEYPRPSYHW